MRAHGSILAVAAVATMAASHGAPPSRGHAPLPPDPAAAASEIRGMLRQDLYEDALDMASAATDRWPDQSSLQVCLGDALYRRGDFEEAERSYRRGVEIDSEDASAHFGVGRTLRTRGRYAEAAESFSRAAALAPGVPRHLRVLANHLARRADVIAMMERYLELTRSLPDRGGEEEATIRNVDAWVALLHRMGDRPLSRLVQGDPVTVPLRGEQPSLKLALNHLRNQRFVFDTGATGLTISPRIAARLKLQPIRPMTITGTGAGRTETGDLVVIDRLALGKGVVLENVAATVRDPTGTEEGLIGPSFFSSFDIGIDLHGGTLSLRRPGEARPGRAIPFRNLGGQIVIPARLQDVTLNAMVDTGSTGTVIARSALARVPGLQTLQGAWLRGESTGIGGAMGQRKVIASGSFAFADRTHKADGLASGDLSGFSRALESEIYILLGAPHLSEVPFTISYRDMTVTFEDPPAPKR